MDDIIGQILEIDKKTADMENETSRVIDQKKIDFKKELKAMEAESLQAVKDQYGVEEKKIREETDKEIEALKVKNDAVLEKMEAVYRENKEAMVATILKSIIEERIEG